LQHHLDFKPLSPLHHTSGHGLPSFFCCTNNDWYSVLEFCADVLGKQIPKGDQNRHNNPPAAHPNPAFLNFFEARPIRNEHIGTGFPLAFSWPTLFE